MLVKLDKKYYKSKKEKGEQTRKQKVEDFFGYSLTAIAYAIPFLLLIFI